MRIKTKEDRRDRIKYRIRRRVRGSVERPRLTVFRSVAHMYVQVVDDATGKTIASASTVESAVKGVLPKKALIGQGVKRVVFDRNGFLYHGRVKAVADAAREAGLEF